MNDLQEIRRFWPKATQRGLRRFVPLSGGTGLDIVFWPSKQLWGVRRWRFRRSCTYIGPTIAAAMAAAGFAERKKGFFAEYNEVDTAVWLMVTKHHADKYAGKTRIPLKSRQRPRKGVRLGKRGRRLAPAASLGHAWDWAQRQNDRREAGQ